jgi:hypothetical protein
MGPIRCPETSAKDYHSTVRNTPEERRSVACVVQQREEKALFRFAAVSPTSYANAAHCYVMSHCLSCLMSVTTKFCNFEVTLVLLYHAGLIVLILLTIAMKMVKQSTQTRTETNFAL